MSKTGSTTADAQSTTTADEAQTVDWGDLWEEFGFDSEDGAGCDFISKTQLAAALQCSDQDLEGGWENLIQDGVDDVALVEQRTDAGALRGYVFVGGDGQ